MDSIIVGYYRGEELVYVARTRNGFVPGTRRRVYEKLKPLVTDECPFVKLPETGRARWGEILDAEKMIGSGIPSLWHSATIRIRERWSGRHSGLEC